MSKSKKPYVELKTQPQTSTDSTAVEQTELKEDTGADEGLSKIPEGITPPVDSVEGQQDTVGSEDSDSEPVSTKEGFDLLPGDEKLPDSQGPVDQKDESHESVKDDSQLSIGQDTVPQVSENEKKTETSSDDKENVELENASAVESQLEVDQDTVEVSTPKQDLAKQMEEIRLQAQNKYGKGEIGWTIEQCQAYLENNIHPPKTVRGNWVTDCRRLVDLSMMSSSELEDFVDGYLEFPDSFDTELVWELVYKRYKLPGNVTKDDAIAFIRTQQPFAMTPDGLLVNDRVRDQKALSQWTYRELRAAYLGHINHSFTEAEVLGQIRRILDVTDKYPNKLLLSTLETEKYSSMSTAILSSNLEEYLQVRKSTTTPANHGKAHAGLLRVIKRLMQQEYHVFKEGMTTLLDFVKREENTIFTDKKAFEHWAHIPLTSTDIRALEDFITLLKMTADPVNRAGIKHGTIASLTRHLVTDDQLQMLLSYYDKK